ncbi:MAG: hypothetical protein PWQ10_87 [Patescibacteria group bacterium]|nr:hypothetical protein [Patescibacteria group bacterium]
MFKKIISNLPFSPALIGQLSFYAKRLKKEEITRKLTVFFVILALVVQSLAVFQPPESANASSSNDLVPGGLGLGENRSLSNFLAPYDANTNKLRDVMNYAGITRDEILSTQFTSFKVGDKLSWGYSPTFSYEQGERQHDVYSTEGQQVTTVYSRPLNLRNNRNDDIWGWIGHSEKMGWFGIMQACGNLVTDTVPIIVPKCDINPSLAANDPNCIACPSDTKLWINDPACTKVTPPTPPTPTPATPKCDLNPSLDADDPNCISCPGNPKLWIDDPTCVPNIIKSKKATNITQGSINATTSKANANDKISYTITTENKGLNSINTELKENLMDILEYSTIVDNGGGTLDNKTNVLSWPNVTIYPGTKQTRTFVIKVLDPIPATAQGSSNRTSYDCIMTNTFGNAVEIEVKCPTVKVVEKTTSELPKTGATENMLFIGIILAITTYFYTRTREINKEIRLVRKNINAGSI